MREKLHCDLLGAGRSPRAGLRSYYLVDFGDTGHNEAQRVDAS